MLKFFSYQIFADDPISTLAYFLLILATVGVWFRTTKWISFAIWILSALLAWVGGRLGVVGFSGLLCFVFFTFFYKTSSVRWREILLIGFFGGVLGNHAFPGIYNWKVLSNVAVSEGHLPISLYLNFDKLTLGFALLAGGWVSVSRIGELPKIFKRSFSVIAVMCGTLLGLGLLFKGIGWDPKWSPFAPLWLFVNLIFACLVEEVFFRGFLQKNLATLLGQKSRKSWVLALVVASLIFGIFHYRGGPVLMGLATVAGLFYGYVFHKTARVEASVLAHFSLNAVHFLLFTYP